MRIHFLGTTGWFCTDQGETTCLLIDAQEAYVILDAGNAFRKVDRLLVDPKKPVYLFLSHFHLDHVYGLHTLPKFRVPQGITVIGQPGLRTHLQTLINTPWTCPIDKLKTHLTLREVEPGAHTDPFPFSCQFLAHTDPCFGYRFTLEGKTVSFCTDTGRCDNLVALGHRADLLITECAWRVRQQTPGWPHLAPEDAAEAARDAQARQLALMHFEAQGYTEHAHRADALQRALAIFPKTMISHDGMVLTL